MYTFCLIFLHFELSAFSLLHSKFLFTRRSAQNKFPTLGNITLAKLGGMRPQQPPNPKNLRIPRPLDANFADIAKNLLNIVTTKQLKQFHPELKSGVWLRKKKKKDGELHDKTAAKFTSIRKRITQGKG